MLVQIPFTSFGVPISQRRTPTPAPLPRGHLQPPPPTHGPPPHRRDGEAGRLCPERLLCRDPDLRGASEPNCPGWARDTHPGTWFSRRRLVVGFFSAPVYVGAEGTRHGG